MATVTIHSSKMLTNIYNRWPKQLPLGIVGLRRNYSDVPNLISKRLADKVAVITASTAG